MGECPVFCSIISSLFDISSEGSGCGCGWVFSRRVAERLISWISGCGCEEGEENFVLVGLNVWGDGEQYITIIIFYLIIIWVKNLSLFLILAFISFSRLNLLIVVKKLKSKINNFGVELYQFSFNKFVLFTFLFHTQLALSLN